MSSHEKRAPFDRETAELLLRRDPAARATHRRLAGLLDAVTAPGHGRELAGEAAAVAAFAAAHHDLTPTARRIPMMKATLAKLLTVKVAAACLAVAGVGGVALATTSGGLPDALPFGVARASTSPTTPHSPGATPTALPTHTTKTSQPGPRAGLRRLCQEYAGHDHGRRQHDLNDPKFGDLVRGAGRKDRDKVDHFCAVLARTPARPNATPSGTPHQPGHSGGKPSSTPGPRPSGPPNGTAGPHSAGR